MSLLTINPMTPKATQLLDVSLSVWLYKCAKTSTARLYIQFNLIHDRQLTHCGLLWPCLLKGNKRSILLKKCFTMLLESLSSLTVLSLQRRCDSVGLKGNQFSWKSNSLAFSWDVTRIKHLYINIKKPIYLNSCLAYHTNWLQLQGVEKQTSFERRRRKR